MGIKPDSKLLLVDSPVEYFEWLEVDVSNQLCSKKELPDIVHLFSTSKKEFEEDLKKIQRWIKPTTAIWVSWYKKSSGKQTDLTENDIRNYALQHNLVDIKVCAVSNEWSGLKLVVPVAKR